MENAIYRKLQEKINEYATGFPATESGVELKILKLLFSPEDAELYMEMVREPQTAGTIAARIGRNAAEVEKDLERMIARGTVLCREQEGRTVYAPAPYMVGLYENLADKMDVAVASLLEEYHKEAFFKKLASLPPLIKYIPVHEAIQSFSQVLPHDDAVAIIKSKKKIAVIDCACRKQVELLGTPTNLIETCFAFDGFAEYYAGKRQQGRFLSTEEALAIQKQCDEAGLITQTTVLKDHEIMCHCDKHCVVLRSWGDSKPTDHFKSNYYSVVDEQACNGCGDCAVRCPIEAVTIGKYGKAIVNLDRCIGCGICVTSCPSQSIALQQKPESEQVRELIAVKGFS